MQTKKNTYKGLRTHFKASNNQHGFFSLTFALQARQASSQGLPQHTRVLHGLVE